MIPNAYSGDDVFQRKLEKLGISMNVFEIKMYLAGILLSPEFMPPSAALEEILLTDTEDEVTFSSENDYMDFMSLFMGLWNQLAGYAGSPSRYPKLSPLKTKFKNKEEKINFILSKADELSSFYIGLDESMASDYFDQSFDLVKAQLGLSMMNDLFCNFYIEHDLGSQPSDQEVVEMLEVAKDFDESWPSSYSKLNEIFAGIRSGKIKLLSDDEMDCKLEEFKTSVCSDDLDGLR